MSQRVRPADNPFNVQRVAALPYLQTERRLETVLDRWQQLGRRAALVGPHGAGKTTLLEALSPGLRAAGWEPLLLFKNTGSGRRLPRHWCQAVCGATPRSVLLLDGYDTLNFGARVWLRKNTHGAGGLIVTAHRRAALPTLCRLTPSPQLLAGVLEALSAGSSQRLDAPALYQSAAGNLREAIRLAYDRHAEAGGV